MKNPFIAIKNFIQEIVSELKKTAWPTKKELMDSTVVVIVGIVILAVYVGVVDFSLYEVVDLFTSWVYRVGR